MDPGRKGAAGHEGVMYPWDPPGSRDRREVAHMGRHVGQMTGRAEMLACFDAVTVNGAKALGLEDYGLQPGCRADMVVLQCRDPVEALRLRPARLQVIRGGREIGRASCRERVCQYV